jgi:tyrosine-specific transport protein
LKTFIQSPAVFIVAEFFAFFALVTSFFGVSLGLIDFLADGLNIEKTAKGKITLCLALFLPPLVIAFFYPGLFLSALDVAGGIGCALLLGLLPVLMVWAGRYRLGHSASRVLPGGKGVLILLVLFVVLELLSELIRGNEFFTI